MKISLRVKAFALVCSVAAVSLTACQKGDVGEQGPVGEQGIQGVQGIPGLNGKTILSGTEAPTTAIGTEGDFYLNKATSELFGPKTAQGWGLALSIKGANGLNGADGRNGADGQNGTNGKDGANGENGKDGAAGKNGSALISGTGKPAETLGVEGDYFIDITNAEIYGPKTAGSWGSAVSLRSSQGADLFVLKGHKFQNVVDLMAEDKINLTNYHNEQVNLLGLEFQQTKEQYQLADPHHYESNIAYLQAKQTYEENLQQLQSDYEDQMRSFSEYHFDSQISLGSKFEALYEDGAVLVYVRNHNEHSAPWIALPSGNQYTLLAGEQMISRMHSTSFISNSVNLTKLLVQPTTISFSGEASGLSYQEVLDFRMDIKIMVLSPTSIHTLSSKKVDTKNITAVEAALNIR